MATRFANIDRHGVPDYATDCNAFNAAFCLQMRFFDEGTRTLSRLVHRLARCHEFHRRCMGLPRTSRRLFAGSRSSIPVCNKAMEASIPVGRAFMENTCTHADQTEFSSNANCLRYSASTSAPAPAFRIPGFFSVGPPGGGAARPTGGCWVF